MSFTAGAKNAFIKSSGLFFKSVKNNFVSAAAIIAFYTALLVAAAPVLKQIPVIGAGGLLFNLFAVALLISFIPVSSPLFSAKALKLSNVFPNWKFILFSICTIPAAFAFFVPLKFASSLSVNVLLPDFLGAGVIFICGILVKALLAVYVFAAAFALFDFNRKASLDNSFINSAKIIFSNKLVIYFFALIYMVLITAAPALAKLSAASCPVYMVFIFFLEAVYYALRQEDEEPVSAGAEVKPEETQIRRPKIKISL